MQDSRSCTCKESGRKCPFSYTDLARSCSSCKTVLAGYVTSYLYFPTIDKIQTLILLVPVPDLSQREHSDFVQVKGLFFFILPKLGHEYPLTFLRPDL